MIIFLTKRRRGTRKHDEKSKGTRLEPENAPKHAGPGIFQGDKRTLARGVLSFIGGLF